MKVSPAGSGNITSPQFTTDPAEYPSVYTCSVTYSLTAVPDTNAGYEFVNWTVNYSTANENPLVVSVADGQKTVTANFRIAEPPPNLPPTADAGDDRNVTEESTVTLDGSGSSDPDDGIRSYRWQQTEGPAVTLSSAAAVSPTFTAPEFSGEPVTLEFQLTVQDFAGQTGIDFVALTVQEYANIPPTADAGDEQVVAQKSQVQLDGSGSFDPDDGIRSYFWQQAQGERVVLSDPASVNPTFTAPAVSGVPEPMEFRLTVEDFAGAVGESGVFIMVQESLSESDESDGDDDSNRKEGGSHSGCFISSAVR